MSDVVLAVTEDTLESLRALHDEQKFHERDLYPGAPDADIRVASESKINKMIASILEGVRTHPRKEWVLAQFRAGLAPFDGDDTEEREEACAYCERVMEILGIEASDGVLDEWLYGSEIADEIRGHEPE
jgi:hypothetical protein